MGKRLFFWLRRGLANVPVGALYAVAGFLEREGVHAVLCDREPFSEESSMEAEDKDATCPSASRAPVCDNACLTTDLNGTLKLCRLCACAAWSTLCLTLMPCFSRGVRRAHRLILMLLWRACEAEWE